MLKDAPTLQTTTRARVITWRSVALGLAGVVFICGLTPYNDYALNNTFLVGNNLPLGVVMFLFLFVLLVNGPLHRFKPHLAFSSGELALAFAMMLTSCTLPSSGLMRYFPPALVSPFWHARSNPEFLALFEQMHLPRWLWPDFKGSRASEWMNDPIVSGYLGRWTEYGPDGKPLPIPYRAWIRPAIAWGIFFAAMFGAMLCMVAIVRRQWYENERLPFPLAQIPLALIEPPKEKRWLNATLSRRSFWIAFAAVFLLHIWNGLGKYWPTYFPTIPVSYNLTAMMSEPPWKYVDQKLKDAAIFFTVVGVTYFLTSSVAFSLWAFYLLDQVYKMWLGVAIGDANVYGQGDQHMGGVFALAIAVLWIGRKHWRLVIAQAFRGARAGEPRGRYLPYPLAFWGFVGCLLVMMGWLVAAGCSAIGAIVIVSLLMTLFFMITRIIAETGLVHGQLQVPIYYPWQLLSMAGFARPVSMETFYHSAIMQSVHYDFREVASVYASHGMKVTDQTAFADTDDTKQSRRVGRGVMAMLALSLAVGYVVSFWSTLSTEYHNAFSKDVYPQMPINQWGAEMNSRGMIVGATVQYSKGNYNPRNNAAVDFSVGFGLVSLLSFLRLRYSWWPLHPIGYIMIGTFPGAHLWPSIFFGWLAKTLILRFGGPKLYVDAKPFFLGLIVGESAAAGFWLLSGIVLSTMGVPYRPVLIMPG